MSELLAVWVTLAPWFFGAAGLGLFVVLTALAVLLSAWPLALLAVLMLVAGVWNLRTALRIRTAQRRGAAPVSPHIPGASRSGRGFTAAAKQTLGTQTRDGVVVIVDGVAAFVPRTEWYGVAVGALSAASVLAVTEVLMMDVPQSKEVLRGLVESTGGLYLDRRSWAWSTRGQFLTCLDPPSMVAVRLQSPHSDLWADRPATPAQRALLRKFAAVGAALFTVFLGGGVLGWWLTGDTDHLITGTWFALMVFLIGVGVRFLAPRPRA